MKGTIGVSIYVNKCSRLQYIKSGLILFIYFFFRLEFNTLAEEFIDVFSDSLAQGHEPLMDPLSDEKKGLDYSIDTLETYLRAVIGGYSGTELGTVLSVKDAGLTLVNGLFDGLQSGNVVEAVTGALGDTGNTLAYDNLQYFLDIFNGELNGNVEW